MSSEIDRWYQASCFECDWYGNFTNYDMAYEEAIEHDEEYHND